MVVLRPESFNEVHGNFSNFFSEKKIEPTLTFLTFGSLIEIHMAAAHLLVQHVFSSEASSASSF